MRVDLLDPPSYSLAYDDALATALGALGADVRLLCSPFAYGQAPAPRGYLREERFYRYARGSAGSRWRTVTKLAEHVPDMLAYRRSAAAAAAAASQSDVAHFQWLTVPPLDLRLLPADLPTVLTIHDPLERDRRGAAALARGSSARLRQLLPKTCGATRTRPIPAAAFSHVDAVIVHSNYARERVIEQHGLEPERVHVIPHGALAPRPEATEEPRDLAEPLPPPELTDDGSPVVLCFGLLRPYKGVQTLLQAWRGITGAQLWIVGRPMMDLAALQTEVPAGVTIVPRFATRQEETALFDRADIVVLPYHHSDRFGFSGVLATALGHGKAIVLSDVGGLSEVGDEGAARLVAPGDAEALHGAIVELLADPGARSRLAAAAAQAAATTYSWDRIARRTLELYATITGK